MKLAFFFILFTPVLTYAQDPSMIKGGQMSSGRSMAIGEKMAVSKAAMPVQKDAMPKHKGVMPSLKEGMPVSKGSMPDSKEAMPKSKIEMKQFLDMKGAKPMKPQVNVIVSENVVEKVVPSEVVSAPQTTSPVALETAPVHHPQIQENKTEELSFFQKMNLFFQDIFNSIF